jgi:hypothetical protein
MDDGVIALNDGSTIFVDFGNGTGYYLFTIDVNGAWKQPNSGGIDVFSFQLLPSGKLIPIGIKGSIITKTNCLTNPNNYCGAEALSDPDYFKKVKKK